MKSFELKKKFFEFFINNQHVKIPNSSLIPENDPSALFINSGMHPLVEYLLGKEHPLGKRLVNCQRCLRTVDLENVGVTKRHHTFFEMLGEWSLGDYWKKESLEWSIHFIVDYLGLRPDKLYATVFKGNSKIPLDEESLNIWKNIFRKYGIEPTIGESFTLDSCPRIILLDENDNFWPKGKNKGPCGPCSEIYYDLGTGTDVDSKYLELCNNVFMEYYQDEDGNYTLLKQKNVDVGWGFERILSVIQNKDKDGDVPEWVSNFETDLFLIPKNFLINSLNLNNSDYLNNFNVRKEIRAILDHVRASIMIIGDGVLPSNKDRGYVLRRLIRRALTFAWKYNNNDLLNIFDKLIDYFIDNLSQNDEYVFLIENKIRIKDVVFAESQKFLKMLNDSAKKIENINTDYVNAELAFNLKSSLGIPLEVTLEIANKMGKTVDIQGFEKLMAKHKDTSRLGSDNKFVGALGVYPEKYKSLHTCAHLFLAGAKKFLGNFVRQRGQDINLDRLRYDFEYPFDQKIPDEKIQEIENWVNSMIESGLIVDYVYMSYENAVKYGVEGVFHDKYKTLDNVTIYRIYNKKDLINPDVLSEIDKEKYVSLEFCGGPHVENTLEIKKFGKFKIISQQSVGKGVRRIKAKLEM